MIVKLKVESLLQKNNPKFGVGLRTEHYTHLYDNFHKDIDYFEAITENHLNSEGPPLKILDHIRKDYDLSFHGVSLSIAAADELDKQYLKNISELYDRYDPWLISDHLCWTGSEQSNTHNLLPFAFDDENLEFLVSKIHRVQDILKRPMAFENLSAYFEFKNSTYSEWEFISKLIKKSGAHLLLDVNNIYVNSKNHDFNPYTYIDAIDSESIKQIHLAGHTDKGEFLFDTHSCPVIEDVWQLYEYTLKTKGGVNTLIEWDEDIPEFDILKSEALKAKQIYQGLTYV